MNYGILEDQKSRVLFEEINGHPRCDKCRSERSDFKTKDKKGHGSYCILLPGFSSEKIKMPVDVLIVGEAHGGGDDDFRKQGKLLNEVSKITQYYRGLPDKSFHQQQVRVLLSRLDAIGMTWVFTDLIKCFIWHRADEDKKLNGRKNRKIAIEHCGGYLEEQIILLRPLKVLGLGNTVARYFGIDKPTHSDSCSVRIGNRQAVYVHSLFPSQRTADLWVMKSGWEPVVKQLR